MFTDGMLLLIIYDSMTLQIVLQLFLTDICIWLFCFYFLHFYCFAIKLRIFFLDFCLWIETPEYLVSEWTSGFWFWVSFLYIRNAKEVNSTNCSIYTKNTSKLCFMKFLSILLITKMSLLLTFSRNCIRNQDKNCLI